MKMKKNQGFTLVELLVVISIIGMLTALLLPAIQAAREAGRRATCINNQRNLGLAMQNYESSKGTLPGFINVVGDDGGATTFYGSWVTTLFPYIERVDIWDEMREGGLFDSINGTAVGTKTKAQIIRESTIAILGCASNPETKATPGENLCYRVNCGRHGLIDAGSNIDSRYCGVFDTNGMTIDSIRDGSSTTLMIGEAVFPSGWASGYAGYQAYPNPSSVTGNNAIALNESGSRTGEDIEISLGFVIPQANASTSPFKINQDLDPSTTVGSGNIGSYHPSIAVVTFCDGHTRTISEGIEMGVLLHLMTPNSKKVWSTHGYGTANSWPYIDDDAGTGKFYQVFDEADVF